MQNKQVTLGPVALTNVLTTNIFSPPTLTGGTNPPPASTETFLVIKHIRIVNKTAGAVTFSLWKDASAGNTAGKEIIGTGLSVAANSAYDWYGAIRIQSNETDKFIVGGAGAATSLTIEAEAEMGVV